MPSSALRFGSIDLTTISEWAFKAKTLRDLTSDRQSGRLPAERWQRADELQLLPSSCSLHLQTSCRGGNDVSQIDPVCNSIALTHRASFIRLSTSWVELMLRVCGGRVTGMPELLIFIILAPSMSFSNIFSCVCNALLPHDVGLVINNHRRSIR